MARRTAKRANRPNPREERNYSNYDRRNKNNVIELEFSSKKRKVDIIPRNINQEEFLSVLENHNKDIIFAIGPAGCGKTYIATQYAIKALKNGDIERIVISRPNTALDDKDIGFLPGDIYSKMAPWVQPILDVFLEYYSQPEIVAMIENRILEIVPVAYIRGRTFKNSIVLFDEAQNTTQKMLNSILTRIGENSRMIITGDTRQSDIGQKNGLSDFIPRYEQHKPKYFGFIKFTAKDVVRHRSIYETMIMYPDLGSD